jgi:ankyrin repeat protein
MGLALLATALWIAQPVAAADGETGAESLIEAAKHGDLASVSTLLDQGADPNASAGDGMTALHWAAERGHGDVVHRLLSAGADPDAKTRIGHHTPLHLASLGGHAVAVRALIESGADVHATTTSSGVTPLHLAAKAVAGDDAVAALIEHGALIDARELSSGQTPLMFAAANNRARAVQELLQRGANPSIQTHVVDVLPSMARDAEASLVFQAALRSHRPADAGEDWQPTPVQVREAVDAQRSFLRSAPPESFDPAPLIRTRPQYPGGPDVDHPPYRETLVGKTGGMTALLHAAREGHLEAAAALLDEGADIDQVSGGDQTSALLIAALNGQFDVAMMLVERGANPDLAASMDGAAPLFAVLQTQWAPKSNYPQPRAHDSQATGYIELLSALLDAGADPNVRLNSHLWYWEYGLTKIGTDLTGATPFWRAAYAQDLEAMRLLAAHGADPNIPTRWPAVGMRERRQQDGRQQEDSGLSWIPEGAPNAYPIHAATGGGFTGLGSFSVRNVPDQFLPAVKYLIEEQGIDVNTLDSWGYTPLHYASSRGDNEMIRYLVDKGGDVAVITRLGQSTADIARGGRAGFFLRVAFPETVALLEGLGSTIECLHTHFLDTGDFCAKAGLNDPWSGGPGGALSYPVQLAAPKAVTISDATTHPRRPGGEG